MDAKILCMKELLNEIAWSADKYLNLIIQNLAQDFPTSDQMNLQYYKSPIPLSTEHYIWYCLLFRTL